MNDFNKFLRYYSLFNFYVNIVLIHSIIYISIRIVTYILLTKCFKICLFVCLLLKSRFRHHICLMLILIYFLNFLKISLTWYQICPLLFIVWVWIVIALMIKVFILILLVFVVCIFYGLRLFYYLLFAFDNKIIIFIFINQSII